MNPECRWLLGPHTRRASHCHSHHRQHTTSPTLPEHLSLCVSAHNGGVVVMMSSLSGLVARAILEHAAQLDVAIAQLPDAVLLELFQHSSSAWQLLALELALSNALRDTPASVADVYQRYHERLQLGHAAGAAAAKCTPRECVLQHMLHRYLAGSLASTTDAKDTAALCVLHVYCQRSIEHAHAPTAPCIKGLPIEHVKLSRLIDVGRVALLDGAILPRLESLVLEALPVDDTRVVLQQVSSRVLMCASTPSTMHTLTINRCTIDDDTLSLLLGALLHARRLQRLVLTWTSLEDASLVRLASFVSEMGVAHGGPLTHVDVRWNCGSLDGREACKRAAKRARVRLLDV